MDFVSGLVLGFFIGISTVGIILLWIRFFTNLVLWTVTDIKREKRLYKKE